MVFGSDSVVRSETQSIFAHCIRTLVQRLSTRPEDPELWVIVAGIWAVNYDGAMPESQWRFVDDAVGASILFEAADLYLRIVGLDRREEDFFSVSGAKRLLAQCSKVLELPAAQCVDRLRNAEPALLRRVSLAH